MGWKGGGGDAASQESAGGAGAATCCRVLPVPVRGGMKPDSFFMGLKVFYILQMKIPCSLTEETYQEWG